MKHVKTALVVGAGITAISLGGIGVASAATNSSSTSGEKSLVTKIASKFNLDKAEVQAVFDEAHAERHEKMEERHAEALKKAVSDGRLTQAQADHIAAVWEEVDNLRGDAAPHEQSDETRDAIRGKMDELKSWAEEQDLDLREILGNPEGRGSGRHHGPWGSGGDKENS